MPFWRKPPPPTDEPLTVQFHQIYDQEGDLLHIDNKISTTKYKVWNFIPKNLFEQFSRIANFYFLIIVLLLTSGWGPIKATTAAFPLIIVVGISMIREGIEDFLRHKSDNKVNQAKAHKLENGTWRECDWQNIHVGEFLLINKDEQVPADLVLFSTSDPDAIAYVDTCNLDGETNLKIHQGIQETKTITEPTNISQLQGSVTCDQPNNLLYTFNGYLILSDQRYPLDNRNVLLRGCILRNTNWAIGLVVYTGLESKLMMNSSAARSKRSKLERGLNSKLISIFIFLFASTFILSIIGFACTKKFVFSEKYYYFFYNNHNRDKLFVVFLKLFVSHITVINAMVPISLYVTLEIVRVFQAGFVTWDNEMFDQETEIGSAARTSNISDDLGQISYIFSDKTGTLTRNVMEFMKCSIAGKMYGSGITEVAYAAAKRRGIPCDPPDTNGKAFKDDEFFQLLRNNPPMEIKHFLWLLSICHAVIPEEDPSQEYGIRFQASSPDEAALVTAAADLGYIFKSRNQQGITLSVNGQDVNVEILNTLEFTSERKRSSVIIRHPETNEIVLYCKGADDLICQRLSEESLYLHETKAHLKQFAADGLRTLCCAMKVIPEDFYQAWAQRFNDASCSINDRDKEMDIVANEIECDLQLVGATAIEDKLQEGVPDAIESLLRAGINVWVITGDKKETAINIGFACSLLSGDMRLIVLDTENEEELRNLVSDALNSSESEKLALVASGASLYHLLNELNRDLFFTLTQKCQSVICCRVSPLQKASVVKIMREKTGKLALAIGDGANDVGMILEADVGVGISGKEGKQAVLSSDYSFSKFKFLKRLLLVHGRINFVRNVELINYSFYKNMCFSFCQIIFDFFTLYSGNTVYDSVMYTIFNVIFTSAPPVVYAGLERDVSLKSMMEIPELYTMDNKKEYFQSNQRFWYSLILGIYHACISFFIPYLGMRPFILNNGKVIGLHEFGLIVYGCVVLIVNLRIATICQYWTWLHHVFIWGSILVFPLTAIIMDVMNISIDLHGVTKTAFSSPIFYYSIIGTTMVALVPVVVIVTIDFSMNKIRNRVLSYERNPSGKKLREEVQEFLPPEQVPPISTTYVDRNNENGYIFDEPANLERIRYQSAQYKTAPPAPVDVSNLPVIKQKTVSHFGLDDL